MDQFEKMAHIFEVGEPGNPSWERFAAHSGIVVFIVPILGFLNYWATPFSGAILAFIVTRRRPEFTAAFAWLPALLLFLWGAWGPFMHWDPAWAHMTRWDYFTNTMFGPDCGASECLGTIFTAVLTGSIGYSFTSYAVLQQSQFNSRSA